VRESKDRKQIAKLNNWLIQTFIWKATVRKYYNLIRKYCEVYSKYAP